MFALGSKSCNECSIAGKLFMPVLFALKAHECVADRTLQLGGLHVLGVHLALTPVFSAVPQKDVVVLVFGILETFQFV